MGGFFFSPAPFPFVHVPWQKLEESAYVACDSEEQQKAVLSLLESHKEERKRFGNQGISPIFMKLQFSPFRLKVLHREVQRREEQRKATAKQDLLGGKGESDKKSRLKFAKRFVLFIAPFF